MKNAKFGKAFASEASAAREARKIASEASKPPEASHQPPKAASVRVYG